MESFSLLKENFDKAMEFEEVRILNCDWQAPLNICRISTKKLLLKKVDFKIIDSDDSNEDDETYRDEDVETYRDEDVETFNDEGDEFEIDGESGPTIEHLVIEGSRITDKIMSTIRSSFSITEKITFKNCKFEVNEYVETHLNLEFFECRLKLHTFRTQKNLKLNNSSITVEDGGSIRVGRTINIVIEGNPPFFFYSLLLTHGLTGTKRMFYRDGLLRHLNKVKCDRFIISVSDILNHGALQRVLDMNADVRKQFSPISHF